MLLPAVGDFRAVMELGVAWLARDNNSTFCQKSNCGRGTGDQAGEMVGREGRSVGAFRAVSKIGIQRCVRFSDFEWFSNPD